MDEGYRFFFLSTVHIYDKDMSKKQVLFLLLFLVAPIHYITFLYSWMGSSSKGK